MVRVRSSGPTVPSIPVTGGTDALKAEAYSSTSMAISLKVNSSTTKLTVSVFTFTRMVKDMRAPGRTIYKMAWARSSSKMVHSIRVNSTRERSTARASIIGRTALSTTENGS